MGKLHCGEGLPDQGPVRAVHDNCEIENQSNCCAMQISTRRAYFVEKLRNQALGSNLTELYSGFLKFYRFSSVYSGHWRTVFCLLKICKRSIEFSTELAVRPFTSTKMHAENTIYFRFSARLEQLLEQHVISPIISR
ncbi:MAG: hypothetical protein ACI85V_002705 [bacterium]